MRQAPEYARALPVFVVLAAAAAAIWPSWPALVDTWQFTADYRHGDALMLLLTVWIFVRALAPPPAQPRVSPLAAAVLLTVLAAWLVAYRAASSIGQQVMIPPILWAAVWLGCGWSVALRTAAPLACLYFAIPVWEFLVPSLQHLAAAVTESGLGLAGVPVSIDGTTVTIPEGSFQIAEGCAGKRYLIASLTIAALFAGASGMAALRTVTYLIVTAALALVMNWIRIMIVIYAGHETEMTHYFVAREHVSLGWALFAVLVVLVCLAGRWLAGPAALSALRSESGAAATAGVARSRALVGLRQPAILATLLVLCLPMAAVLYAHYALAGPLPVPMDLPVGAALQGWRGPLDPDPSWSPRYAGASSQRRASYRDAAGAVELYVAEYQRQRLDAKLIRSANSLLPDDWQLIGVASLDAARLRPPFTAAPTLLARTPTRARWVISYLYQVGDTITPSALWVQWVYGTRSWSRPLPTRVVAIAAECGESCEQARGELERFWGALGPSLLQSG